MSDQQQPPLDALALSEADTHLQAPLLGTLSIGISLTLTELVQYNHECMYNVQLGSSAHWHTTGISSVVIDLAISDGVQPVKSHSEMKFDNIASVVGQV